MARFNKVLVAFQGETHRLRIRKIFPRDETYTPVFLEINGQMEEFLVQGESWGRGVPTGWKPVLPGSQTPAPSPIPPPTP